MNNVRGVRYSDSDSDANFDWTHSKLTFPVMVSRPSVRSSVRPSVVRLSLAIVVKFYFRMHLL